MEVKEKIGTGDFVVINKDAQVPNGYPKVAKDRNYPLFVHGVLPNGYHVYTRQLSSNDFAPNPFIISHTLVTKITKEESERMTNEINAAFYKEIEIKVEKLRSKRIAIGDRKEYSIQDRTFLDTNINFCMLVIPGEFEKAKYDVTKVREGDKNRAYVGAACCSFSKTTNDILIYIPKIWLSYFGYNGIDLKSWFKFLEDCEIGFNGEITGEKTLEEAFGNKANEIIRMNSESGNVYYTKKEECFEIYLRGANLDMITYLRFILIRFLYSSLYWTIPLVAMKIQRNLPKLTNWECLMIAHCNENYNPYYSLTANTEIESALPSKSNSPGNILKVLNQLGSGMNRSFTKYRDDIAGLRKAIRQENYEVIEELVNKYRNVN